MKTFCGFSRDSLKGSALVFVLTIALTACGPSAPVDSGEGTLIDEEVNQRVAQIELEQRLADLERRLEEQSLTVEEKDRLIADQRLLLEEKNRTAQANSAPFPVSSQPATAPVLASGVGNSVDADYSVFYERLEPHGTWLETPQFGEIWQPAPRYTPQGWQPYTRGEWTYADVGWTWVSSEPFGWATYHYGRWSNISGRGWCWIPGNQWAPAWVSWRTGRDYVGWAPLPVQAGFRGNRIGVNIDIEFDSGPSCYNFVPNRYFGSSSIYRYVVPRNQNVAIIGNTTNVTNIITDNNVVINQGPNYTSLNASQVNPIRTARLQREAILRNQGNLNPTFLNGQLRVAAPAVGQGSPARRAALQRAERLERIETVTGWEQVRSPAERQQLREQLVRQNQREQARNQAIAAADSTTVQNTPPARKTLIEQRAQSEVQARRDVAQRERDQQARLAAARQQAGPPPPAAQTNQGQREAQARRDVAQRDRDQQARAAAARQQSPPQPSAQASQAQREALVRREAAQREREQQVRVLATRQQAAQMQRQPQQQAVQRQNQPQRQSAPSQPNAAQIQAQRQVQARREAAQADREQNARAEEQQQANAQAQRQRQVMQQQSQQRPQTSNANAVNVQRQIQARQAAQAQRQQQIQAAQGQH